MKVNQYFISTINFESPENGNLFTLDNLKIWVHESLETTELTFDNQQLFLLGFIFNPTFPEKSNQEILKSLAVHSFSSIEFFNELNQLAGRFVLIVKENDKTIILNDPAAQRQVFYTYLNDDFYCTSSPKLFYDVTGMEFVIPPEKQKIISSKRFKLLEEWFPGDEYLDDKLNRLLPNFLIETEKKEIKRIPFTVQTISKEILKKRIRNTIYGSMEACIERFSKILFAVTAGSDSRLIFNSMPREEKVEYFLYKRESESDTDLIIAKQLTGQKKINLSVIKPEKLTSKFLEFYKPQFLFPRVLSKLRNIEWLSDNYQNSNTVVIAGYAGEMLRNSTNSINPYHKNFNSSQDFTDYFHYPPTEYLTNSMGVWLNSTPSYLKKCRHLSLLDLFHWEHHMAPYCAQYAYEQDISGVEIFCPLSNRQLILDIIHNTTVEERSAYNGLIYQVINENTPEWKEIPYNPKPFLKKMKDEVFKILPLKIVNRLINR